MIHLYNTLLLINYKIQRLKMTNFEMVKKFMKIFGQKVKEKAEFPEKEISSLRYELIKEELEEFKEALEKKDLIEAADALTDILYVTYGAGHAFGINLDKCFKEVQNSNMSKLGLDGKPIYNDKGKVMKGPNYFKPNLEKYL
jgi:predicted HAD superfamily Cof-like phosphohydrolase